MTFLTPLTEAVGTRTPRINFRVRGVESWRSSLCRKLPLAEEVPRGGEDASESRTPCASCPLICSGAGRVLFLEMISSMRGGSFSFAAVVSLGGSFS